ncbi:unnamed protein product [Nezara viridula]|uniref:Uncharacterized protein n=1 Tax=Nezara viridula TaxID=85310 RepID=A0A9P0HNP8_NEZVI|nr:unnamed protein product [Nezara viridula]
MKTSFGLSRKLSSYDKRGREDIAEGGLLGAEALIDLGPLPAGGTGARFNTVPIRLIDDIYKEERTSGLVKIIQSRPSDFYLSPHQTAARKIHPNSRCFFPEIYPAYHSPEFKVLLVKISPLQQPFFAYSG